MSRFYRDPLVRIPDPVKVLRVEDVIARWEARRYQPGGIPDPYLLAEIKTALGQQLPEENP